MRTKVYALKDKKGSHQQLFPTYELADKYPGTAYRKMYEIQAVKLEVAFVVIHDGWSDYYIVSLHKTYGGAQEAKAEAIRAEGSSVPHLLEEDYEIVIWELKK